MLILNLIDVQYSQKTVFSFEKGSSCQNHFSSGSLYPVKNTPSTISDSPPPLTPYCSLENPGDGAKYLFSLSPAAFVPWIAKNAPTYMFDWVHNTYTSEGNNKNTRTTSFMLFLCFYCWLWTNFVHWFSCIFDIFHKIMFLLFWTCKHYLRKVLEIEKNRWHNTLLKCLRAGNILV